jgi:Helix-turn-helix domain
MASKTPRTNSIGEERYVTVDYVAQICGVSISAVKKALYRGTLPSLKLFGRRVVSSKDLAVYLAEQRAAEKW